MKKKEQGRGGVGEGQVDETGGDKRMRRGWRLETKETEGKGKRKRNRDSRGERVNQFCE